MDEPEKEQKFEQVNVWIRDAVAALETGALDRAKDLFLKVVEAAPNFADGYYNLGVICDLQKNPDQAIKYYVKALMHNPKHAQCQTNLGAAHSNAGRFQIAVPFFTRAIENNPTLLQPRLNLGITHRHMEQPGPALEALKGALDLEPRNAYVLYLAGCCAQESGLATEADRHLRTCLEIRPDYTDALIVLVDVLIELEDLESAVELAEGFVKRNPNNASARECLLRIQSIDPL